MNCHAYRNHFTQASFQRTPLSKENDSDLAAHREACADCRRWTTEQHRLDEIITHWAADIPSIELTDRIVNAFRHSENLPQSSDSRKTTAVSRKLSLSRRGLATLVVTLAASLLLVIPQLSIGLRQKDDRSQLASRDTLESGPVESIVSSIRNVVGNVTASPSAAASRLPASSLVPDWQVGTIQFTRSDAAAFPAPRWADLREDLQPLESEVKQAFDFIWSALPEDEI